MATIRRQGKSWRAEVRRHGISRSKCFARKLEALAWAEEQEQAIAAGRDPGHPGRDPLRSVLGRYAAEISPQKRGRRWEQIRLAALARDPLADRLIQSITPDDLGQWRDRRAREVQAGTVLREMTLLTAVFEHARREWRMILVNPWRDVRKPATPRHRERLMTDEEVDRICLALGYDDARPLETRSQQIAVMLLLALETAMRGGELADLEWARVDLRRRFVRLVETKNGAAREVPLSPRAVELFMRLRGLDAVRCFTASNAVRDALFRRARDAAGIRDLHFHDSRATALTRLARRLDVLQLARMVGHRDPKSLMDYYRETAEEIAKRL